MFHIKKYKAFEGFTLKNGKFIYCHGCGHSFDHIKSETKKVTCPSCAAMGFLKRSLAYLKPIERKF